MNVEEIIEPSDFISEFDNAYSWLVEICGRPAKIGRFRGCREILQEVLTADGKHFAKIRDYKTIYAINEALELIQIWRMYRADRDILPVDKLGIYAGGPESARTEYASNSSNLARNTGFELTMSATLKRRGFDMLKSNESDIIFTFHNSIVMVECKRPQSEAKYRRAIKDGLKQLEQRSKNTFSGTFWGIIALAVGKSLHKGENIIVAENDKAIHEYCHMRLKEIALSIDEETWGNCRHSDYCQILLLVLHVPAIDEAGKIIKRAIITDAHGINQTIPEKQKVLLGLIKKLDPKL
jgi:hypothetical protein